MLGTKTFTLDQRFTFILATVIELCTTHGCGNIKKPQCDVTCLKNLVTRENCEN